MRHARVAWVIAAIGLVGCGGSGGGDYRNDEANFRAHFRGSPKVQKQTQPTPAGDLTTTTIMETDGDKITRSVSYSTIPAALRQGKDANTLLDNAVRGMGQSWMLGNQGPATIDGHPGRHVPFEAIADNATGDNGQGLCRCFIVGDRIYQVVIVGPKSKVKDETLDEFVNSFKLLKPVDAIVKAEVPAPAPIAKSDTPPPGTPAPAPQPAAAPPPQPAASAPVHQPSKPPGEAKEPSTDGPAKVVSFEWVDEKEDVVGGHGDASKPDGTKDQHFRLVLDAPEGSTLEEMTITSGGFNKWVTKPTPGLWAIAIHRDGQPMNRAHVETVGKLPGKCTLDLYVNTGIGVSPGTPFDLKAIVSSDGRPQAITAHCERPKG